MWTFKFWYRVFSTAAWELSFASGTSVGPAVFLADSTLFDTSGALLSSSRERVCSFSNCSSFSVAEGFSADSSFALKKRAVSFSSSYYANVIPTATATLTFRSILRSQPVRSLRADSQLCHMELWASTRSFASTH